MSTNRNNYMRSNNHAHMDSRMRSGNCMQATPYSRTNTASRTDSYHQNACGERTDPCVRTGKEQIDSFHIGMTYVPWQVFRDMYDPHQGLDRGTIFRELDYPFYGKRGNCP